MRTAAYSGRRTMTVADAVPQPPRPDEVQIAVAYVGLCGTDLHILHGEMDERVRIPTIIGHEMSGTVVALGEGVWDWSVGDRVTVMPLDWDGTCPACRAGHQHVCQHLRILGVDLPGALQGRWNVKAARLVALPDSLRLDHAALVEPAAIAVHDVRRSELSAEDKVVVVGGGPIGLLIAAVAREFGAECMVVEIDAERRSTAAELGFGVIDPAAEDQSAVVETWTGGAGADVVFEVSGSAAAVLGATGLVKVRGTLVIVAIHPQARPLDLHRVFLRELRIIGARVHQRADFETAVELLDGGRLPADRMITAIEPIANVQAAFLALESGGAMKILIDVGGQHRAP